MSAIQFKKLVQIEGKLGRAGVIETPHGNFTTPAFIAVGTKATVKSLTPEQIRSAGAQVVLANTYHLYLEPGDEIVAKAGGFPKMMGWNGPSMTDSGGFQAFSLGAAYGKGISKVTTEAGGGVKTRKEEIDSLALEVPEESLVKIDEEGVTFKSYRDGSSHRFTPERSMEIQKNLGADILFAFDECTSPTASYEYQKEAIDRTHRWAERSLSHHKKIQAYLDIQCPSRKQQALFGVVQGGQFEDLRRLSAEKIGAMDFEGFGIGGSFSKKDIGTAVYWVNKILPDEKPRHLLGIGEPIDMFEGVENGCDTFDCVIPTRLGRHGTLITSTGKMHVENSEYKTDFSPIEAGCECYTCKNFTRAYLSHLFRAGENLAGTLASIHNLHFLVQLVEKMRQAILDGNFPEFKENFMKKYSEQES